MTRKLIVLIGVCVWGIAPVSRWMRVRTGRPWGTTLNLTFGELAAVTQMER